VKSWDDYFYRICLDVASNSKCLSRQIGSVLVKEHSIISTGYNGPPRGVPHCNVRHLVDPHLLELLEVVDSTISSKVLSECPRRVLGFASGQGLEYCVAAHAERNALINAARNGICTKGTTLYMTCSVPCVQCMTEIINAGVEEIVVVSLDYYDISSKYLLEQSNVKLRLFDCLED